MSQLNLNANVEMEPVPLMVRRVSYFDEGSNFYYLKKRDELLADQQSADWSFWKRRGDTPNPVKYLVVYCLLMAAYIFQIMMFPKDNVQDGFSATLFVMVIFIAAVALALFIVLVVDTIRYLQTSQIDRRDFLSCLRGVTTNKERKLQIRLITGCIGSVIFIFYAIISILVYIELEQNDEGEIARMRAYVGCSILTAFLLVLVIVDYFDAFHVMVRMLLALEQCFPQIRWFLIGMDIILAIVLLMQVENLDNWAREFEYVSMFFIFYISIIIIGYYWDFIGHYLGNDAYPLSVCFFTLFGGVFIFFCRFLHDPDIYRKEGLWAWHARSKNISKVLHDMIVICILVTLFYPLGMCILSPCFVSFALFLSGDKDAIELEVQQVICIVCIFMVIAHVMMILPMVPASFIDICGGFIFVQIFQEAGQTFQMSLSITMTLLLASHFTGNCLQWFLGQLPIMQGWLNRTCSVMVLATSDAALKNQGCGKVGLLQSIAPDTINGFAQGSSNLPFCTQFWSVWSALPSAIFSILIGVCFSESSLLPMVPIFVLVAIVTNIGMSSWASKILQQEILTEEFTMSSIKWEVLQFMVRSEGLTPTKTGWEKDVFELAELYDELLPIESAMNKDLTDVKIGPHKHKELMQYYKKKKDRALDEHYGKLLTQVGERALIREGLLIKQEQYMIDLDPYFFWDYQRGNEDARFFCIPEGKYFFQILVFTLLWSTMAYSSTVLSVNNKEIVERGTAVIYDNEDWILGVVSFVVHILLAMLYFFNEVISVFCDLGRRTRNLRHNVFLVCCRKGSVGDVETDFRALEYDVIDLESKVAEIRVRTDKEFPFGDDLVRDKSGDDKFDRQNFLTRKESIELKTYSAYWDEWDNNPTQENRKMRFVNSCCAIDEWCCMTDAGGCINISRVIKHWKLDDNGLNITRIIIAVQTLIDHYSDAVLAVAWFLQGRYLWSGIWLGCNFLSTSLPGLLLLFYGQPLWIALPMFVGMGMIPLIYKVVTTRDKNGKISRKYIKQVSDIDTSGWKADFRIRNADRLFRKYERQKDKLRDLIKLVEDSQQTIKDAANMVIDDQNREEDKRSPGHNTVKSRNADDRANENGKSEEPQAISSCCLCCCKSRKSTLIVEDTVPKATTLQTKQNVSSANNLQKAKSDLEVDIKFLKSEMHTTLKSYRDYQTTWIGPYENYCEEFKKITADEDLRQLLVEFRRELACLAQPDSGREKDEVKDNDQSAQKLELLEQNFDESLFKLYIANLSMDQRAKPALKTELKTAFVSACETSQWIEGIKYDITVQVCNDYISWSSKAFAKRHIQVDYQILRAKLSKLDSISSAFKKNKKCIDNMKRMNSQLTELDRSLTSIAFELNSPDIYKLWEVTTESLPQLFLQIYVLLVGELSHTQILGIPGDVILYGSLSLSFISNVLGTTRMFEPRGCRMILISLLYGAFDTAWRGFSLCIPLSNPDYSYIVALIALVFALINGLVLGNFFIRRTELQISHGSAVMWFGSFFLGAILFLCATPVIFLVSSSGVDPSVSFVNWASAEAIWRLVTGLILMSFSNWKQRYLQIAMSIICGLVSVALFWLSPELMQSIPRNNIFLDPFGNYRAKKTSKYKHDYVIRQRIEVNSSTADEWLPGFVSGYGIGRNGRDLSKIQVIYWAKTDAKVLYYQKEIDSSDDNFSNRLRPRKVDSGKDDSGKDDSGKDDSEEEKLRPLKQASTHESVDEGFGAVSLGVKIRKSSTDSSEEPARLE